MTTEHAIANVLLSGVLLTALSWLYFWAYAEYRVDRTRHNLFRLRSQLFDLGAAGEIEFDSPAYGMMRTMINGAIRYAHRATVVDAFLMSRSMRSADVGKAVRAAHAERWKAGLDGLNPKVRDQIRAIHAAHQRILVEQIFIRSPLIWVIATPLVLVLMLVNLWSRAANVCLGLVLPRFGADLDLIATSEGSSTGLAGTLC